MSGVAGVCSGLVAVFHAQRVCPVENPCVWPSWVPPRRCACVYDAIFVGRSTSRINMLSSPCLCTANSCLRELSLARHLPVIAHLPPHGKNPCLSIGIRSGGILDAMQ